MERQTISFLRFALTIALAVGIVLSSNAQSQSNDLAKIAEIMTQHQSEIEDHGHVHEDIVDVIHAYQGHAHEMADHDHNVALLPPKRSTGSSPLHALIGPWQRSHCRIAGPSIWTDHRVPEVAPNGTRTQNLNKAEFYK